MQKQNTDLMAALFSIGARLKILLILFFLTPLFINAQERSIRIVWSSSEYIWRYSVEIERLEDRTYKDHLQEYTAKPFLNASLLPGEYRFRIIPHDILDRPGEGTQWIHFEISHIPAPLIDDLPGTSAEVSSGIPPESEQFLIIDVEDYNLISAPEPEPALPPGPQPQAASEPGPEPEPGIEETTPSRGSPRFNTLGISVGTTFSDPMIVASVHGTYSPVRNFYAELGCDIGFVSQYNDVKSYYSVYPFAHLGFFMPFRGKGGFFTGAGCGYMFCKYTFESGKADVDVFAADLTAGVNIFDMFNIFYTFRTDFGSVSQKLSVSYVYRFK